MADSHEAQLLNDLLRDLARNDAQLDAAHLEARVMSAAGRSTPPGLGGTRLVRWSIAAAVVLAVLVPARLWLGTQEPVQNVQVKRQAAADVPAEVTGAEASRPGEAIRSAKTSRPAKAGHYVLPRYVLPRNSQTALESIAEAPIAQAPIAHSPDEFVALMPMTEQELTGSLQIVRVQMPRASLGTLRSPLEHPNELVEADVLLGEDGMARAIRVSTSGSVYPWRSR